MSRLPFRSAMLYALFTLILPSTSKPARVGLQDIELQAISQRACWNFATTLWFCLRWRATARYTFGTMNAQIERCSRPRPRHTWQW
jgi:hypothetical protein